ncbi:MULTISPECIES: hypothetical protein [unclassified Sedimentibacter]|uniref:hypothetical protein n=1 Tax=unclassified Sedimentibacter TaxID=2649220 RepID=UPI0027DF85FE|nr:hypothetical protein [Sedimentibacter sp. MB35-C1]WMJ76695.1 hypothetical protein RBQ61_14115 [Sedimentibacter sp. MB35-C1]
MLKNIKLKIFTIIFIIFFICYFYNSVENVHSSAEKEKYDILADAIKRSAVQCYAIEGFYPPDITYLENEYGLIIDHNKYVISYSIFASNIMPDIEIYLK